MPQTSQLWSLKHFYMLKRIQDGRAQHDTVTQEQAGTILDSLIVSAKNNELERIADRLAYVEMVKGEKDYEQAYTDQLNDLKRWRARLEATKPRKVAR